MHITFWENLHNREGLNFFTTPPPALSNMVVKIDLTHQIYVMHHINFCLDVLDYIC